MGSCADFASAFFSFFFDMLIENSKSDDDVSFRRPPLVLSGTLTSFG